jgi:hypothetical protein
MLAYFYSEEIEIGNTFNYNSKYCSKENGHRVPRV